MRRVFWVPEGEDALAYRQDAIDAQADLMSGRCESIDKHLNGDYETARLIYIPTIHRFGCELSARIFCRLDVVFETEFNTEAKPMFIIESLNLETDEWEFVEKVYPVRVSEWTHIATLGYSEAGYYRAWLYLDGELSNFAPRRFYYYE